ncbi:DUF3467 domain-containing protein [Blastococcus sp. SYSU D00669]
MADEQPQSIEIGAMDVPDYLRPTYANFANVGHTPFDFRLTFALLKAPRPGPETAHLAETGTIAPEAVADLILPVGVIPGLIAALRENYEKYLDLYGLPGIGREDDQ